MLKIVLKYFNASIDAGTFAWYFRPVDNNILCARCYWSDDTLSRHICAIVGKLRDPNHLSKYGQNHDHYSCKNHTPEK